MSRLVTLACSFAISIALASIAFALLQRYTRQLDQQEDRLVALQKEVPDLNGEKGES